MTRALRCCFYGGMKMKAVLATIMATAIFLGCTIAHAQEEKYLSEKPVRRLALVVGFAGYTNAPPLPGNITDAEKMRDILTDAQFDVTYVPDVATRQQFLKFYFGPFSLKIRPDDFVVVYFSGHGFNYAGENYLMPLNFPTDVFDTELQDKFLSATAMQDVLLEQKPGVLLIFLDACRTIADFVKVKPFRPDEPPDPNRVPKSLTQFKESPGNVIVSFAAEKGLPAEGSSVQGQLSVFTKALAKYLPAPDTEFSSVRKGVRAVVLRETGDKQTPWFSESSSAEVHFNPTKLTFDQERTLWKAILDAGDREEVDLFVRRHSISRHVAAARQWLQDHPKDHRKVASVDFTRISPDALEIGWANAGGVMANASNTVKLRNISGPLAFPRLAKTTDKLPSNLDINEVLLNGSVPPQSNVGFDISSFAKHGTAIVTGRVGGKAEPKDGSIVVADIKPGTKLEMTGFTKDNNDKAWVEAKIPSSREPIYIPIPKDAKSGVTDIGKPLLEVSVPGARMGLQSAIDEEVVLAALTKLRQAKSSIERISVSAPKTDDSRLSDVYRERTRYLIQVLSRAGVSPGRVSLSNASDVTGEKLRMRIFGN